MPVHLSGMIGFLWRNSGIMVVSIQQLGGLHLKPCMAMLHDILVSRRTHRLLFQTCHPGFGRGS
jgi:hypothetical protein